MENLTYRHSDVDLNFRKHPLKGDVLRRLDSSSIKQSVKNLVLMSAWDKPFHPEIQCGVTKLLFNPITSPNANAIETLIETVLGSWEPRISITDIDVIPDYDQGFYYVNIVYSIIDKPTQLERLEFTLDRMR